MQKYTSFTLLCFTIGFSVSSSDNFVAAETTIETSRFLTVHPLDDDEANDSPLKRKMWTRKIWEKNKMPEVSELPIVLDGEPSAVVNIQPVSATEKYTQLAKYSTHHLPDPESRCASRMVGIGLASPL